MHAQSNVQDGLKTILEQYTIIKKKQNTQCDNMIDQLLPRIERCDGSDMWQAIELKQSLLDLAKEHIQNCSGANQKGLPDHHIAVHVRRGDYKYFNHDLHLESATLPVEQQVQIQDVWSQADVAVQASGITVYKKKKICLINVFIKFWLNNFFNQSLKKFEHFINIFFSYQCTQRKKNHVTFKQMNSFVFGRPLSKKAWTQTTPSCTCSRTIRSTD